MSNSFFPIKIQSDLQIQICFGLLGGGLGSKKLVYKTKQNNDLANSVMNKWVLMQSDLKLWNQGDLFT